MNKYDLMAISTETAGKLLQGEFKTFDEFNKSVDFSQGDKDIYILYREFRNENRKEDIYIIETLFLDK